MDVLLLANDQTIKAVGLRDPDFGDYINDPTGLDVLVEVTLKDATGEEVEGQDWPTRMSYVDDSDGDYKAVLEDDLELVDGAFYTIDINADAGADAKANWHFVRQSVYRTP